jgi:hypothetical protein
VEYQTLNPMKTESSSHLIIKLSSTVQRMNVDDSS